MYIVRGAQLAKGPLEVFQLFFTTVIFGAIVEQNKLFAQKGKKLDLCVEELMAFVGINIAMGIMHLLQVSDYWSMNRILATLWFPVIIAFTVCSDLHLVDSTLQKKKEHGYDPLLKVRFLVGHLAAVYLPIKLQFIHSTITHQGT